MNEICGICSGYVGDFVYSGSGAKICNCKKMSTFDEFKEELMKDDDFKNAYLWGGNQDTAFALELMRAKEGISQKELAELINTRQESISRAESYGCSYEFLTRAAKAMGYILKISFEKVTHQ